MIVHSTYRHLALYSPSDLDVEAVSGLPAGVRDRLREVHRWAIEFACQPHPELGRKGHVCPYVKPSMDKGLFWLTAYRGHRRNLDQIRYLLLLYRDWFLELEPREGIEGEFKTILVVFPDVMAVEAPSLIDVVQEDLKPDFVRRRVMIGEFHPLADQSGIWNPEFRPLRSPVPMLVIRHMKPTDIFFLRHEASFVEIYLSKFGTDIPPPLESIVNEAAARHSLAPRAAGDGVARTARLLRQRRSVDQQGVFPGRRTAAGKRRAQCCAVSD